MALPGFNPSYPWLHLFPQAPSRGAFTWLLAGLQGKQMETKTHLPLSRWKPVRAEGDLGKLRSKGELGCSHTWLEQKAAFH